MTSEGMVFFNIEDAEQTLRQATEKAQERTNKLLESTRAKAEEILAEALKKRDEIHAQARQEGRDQGYEEGLKEGRIQGGQTLIQEKQEELDQQAKNLEKTLQDLPQKLNMQRQCLLDEARQDVMRLVLEIVSIAVKKEIGDPGETINRLVEDLITQIVQRRLLTITIHPDQKTALETLLPKFKERFREIAEISLKTNDGMELCEVIVANEISELRASPETAIERLRNDWGL